MVRQIGPHFQEPSLVVLQDRIHRLEKTVAALSDAVRVLASGLADGLLAEQGSNQAAEAASRARDLLLALQTPRS